MRLKRCLACALCTTFLNAALYAQTTPTPAEHATPGDAATENPALDAAAPGAQLPLSHPHSTGAAHAAVAPSDGSPQLFAALCVGYESMYVSSGAQAAYGSFQSSVELGYAGFTASLWANNPLDTQRSNPAGPFSPEYRIYGGYETGITDWLSASAGFTYYFYTEKGAVPNRTRELNVALGFDLPIETALEYNYDFDLQQHEIALVLGYEYMLDEVLPIKGFSLAAAAAVGYLHADKPESDQGPANQPSDGYTYFQSALDVVYTHKSSVRLYAGPRFATNNNGSSNIAGRETNVWWGCGASIAF